ncbi:DUF397 domain-containing protein [Nocardia cyriacigeorgica]|uniref:DUF397 domain-containing protein n=1 Tax=Nocardia cyriacigeorgica TaxID=135487 RepID=A0A6P1DC60_9NOCA|nr:DUF397 domain-containing protein [Nocardia cyriacigeorgica]NEW39112.1 DUF397 domain-containing protein [Nocardia cyriacigeorgica]NEW47778.1 DUF397 domain-containing protein [Nocardia cyriacigeorgica]NEW52748.1 DUF397 domain-containing protein [Nocardia cyriacigeorgica]NEW57962.1 DUF397 domain-containing protein [Nocardia cyriacigeorgica]
MSVDPVVSQWFKSSYSQGDGECVEVAFLDSDLVGVRDSKNPSGAALLFTPSDWKAFTRGITTGRFDRR